METGQKYNIVYADPPWRYDNNGCRAERRSTTGRWARRIYVRCPWRVSARKTVRCFLWVTFPQLPEALRVMESWGFRYKTVAFVWLKQNRKSPGWFYGLGFWTRGNAEICLLGVKGHPRRRSARVHQFIISPLEAHSKKPDETREKIVELMGDLPRVELFARQRVPGWEAWGNEVESSVVLEPEGDGRKRNGEAE